MGTLIALKKAVYLKKQQELLDSNGVEKVCFNACHYSQ